MTPLAGLACAVWALLTLLSLGVWRAPRRRGALFARRRLVVGVVTVEVTGIAAVALMAGLADPLSAPWSWFAVGLAAAAALLSGGAVTLSVLALADTTSRPGAARVQRTILRGGTWIGALERLAMTATLVAGWPEGMAGIVAVKALARYPELKAAQNTGAIERFIIGTFTSLGWAAACAGVALVLTRS